MPHAAPIHKPHVAIGSLQSYDNRTSAAERGYGGKKWERLRRQVFLRDKYRCQDCHRLCIEKSSNWRERPHCDHVIAKPIGTDEPTNLQTLCGSCHSTKTGRERGGGIK